jgi:serine/threonine protein kinase
VQALADIYGGRYKNLGSIRGGAQGDIFRVRDLNSPTGEEFALKRLRDNSRCDRFLREIEAVRALDHPNVVKILDHSGAPDSDHPKHKYWFTMPIAAEGNLEARAGLYEGNLDGVLKVAAQLTEALRIAHEKGIVHRDVKPANILFPKKDHEAWLSDFGICHYAAAGDGLTDAGDVMGPRGFTAPELEHGNSAAVTPAADLYSLGKVIFYMISGGRSVAREHLDLIEFTSVFARGERFGLLRALLTRLIAPFDQRIQTATEVSRELDYIAEWDQRARELALSPDALAAVDAARGAAAKQKAANERGAAAMKTRESQITLAQNGIVTWLRSQLKLVAAYLE